jgi:hypothetical protein
MGVLVTDDAFHGPVRHKASITNQATREQIQELELLVLRLTRAGRCFKQGKNCIGQVGHGYQYQ